MARQVSCTGEALPAVRLAFEKRMCLRVPGGTAALSTPSTIAEFIGRAYGCKPQEAFLVLHLGPKNVPVYLQEVALGGMSSVPLDPRVVFSGALISGASALILIHNHPSGDPEPSADDIATTRQLLEGGLLLGLKVLDHIIIARGGHYVSLVERGAMPKAGRFGELDDDDDDQYGSVIRSTVRRRRTT